MNKHPLLYGPQSLEEGFSRGYYRKPNGEICQEADAEFRKRIVAEIERAGNRPLELVRQLGGGLVQAGRRREEH